MIFKLFYINSAILNCFYLIFFTIVDNSFFYILIHMPSFGDSLI